MLDTLAYEDAFADELAEALTKLDAFAYEDALAEVLAVKFEVALTVVLDEALADTLAYEDALLATREDLLAVAFLVALDVILTALNILIYSVTLAALFEALAETLRDLLSSCLKVTSCLEFPKASIFSSVSPVRLIISWDAFNWLLDSSEVAVNMMLPDKRILWSCLE